MKKTTEPHVEAQPLEVSSENAARIAYAKKELEMRLLDLRVQIESNDAVRDGIAVGIARDVAGELDDNGKKRFTNEDARKSEVARRLADNSAASNLANTLGALHNAASEVEIELRLQKDLLAIVLAFAKGDV